MRYEEFVDAVKKSFRELEPTLLEEEIAVYFDAEKDFLEEQYDLMKHAPKVGVSVASVAYCLFMMR